MVHLTKIYTRTGDNGGTSIANNIRVNKISPLIEAIGAVDEANSAIGLIENVDLDVLGLIEVIQHDLFDLGAELSGSKNISISESRVAWLEQIIDRYNEHLQPLNSFILPTGVIHHARAITRRAERSVWMAIEIHEFNDDMKFSREIPKYLNRLSDLLFVIGRYINRNNERKWVPSRGKNS